MLKRRPRKTIKISLVAKEMGVCSETIKRIAKKRGWQITKYTDGPTSPGYLFARDVEQFQLERQGEQ
jgi:hypothetical protein